MNIDAKLRTSCLLGAVLAASATPVGPPDTVVAPQIVRVPSMETAEADEQFILLATKRALCGNPIPACTSLETRI